VGATRETHCDACFTGEYPLPDGAGGQSKDAFEQAVPLIRA
jgi:amidophosphoribosyltransferase